MDASNSNINTKTNQQEPAPVKRGPGFTSLEDLMVCKAFIAASEDPIIGASQKGKAFKAKMHAMYVAIVDKQAAYDRMMMAQLSAGTRANVATGGVGPGVYHPRTQESLYARFKDKISPDVSKFLGVMDTTPKGSGTTEQDFIQECLDVFKERYGRPFDFVSCYEYLQDKAKYTSYVQKLEEEEEKKPTARPRGTKAAKKAAEDAALIKQVLDQSKDSVSVLSSQSSSQGPRQSDLFFKEAVGFLSATGDAIKTYMEQQQDARIVELLDTPERRELVKEQAKLRLAEMRAKRRRLEDQYVISPLKDNSPDKD